MEISNSLTDGSCFFCPSSDVWSDLLGGPLEATFVESVLSGLIGGINPVLVLTRVDDADGGGGGCVPYGG